MHLAFTENQVARMAREAFYGDEFDRIDQGMSVAGSGFRLGYLHPFTDRYQSTLPHPHWVFTVSDGTSWLPSYSPRSLG